MCDLHASNAILTLPGSLSLLVIFGAILQMRQHAGRWRKERLMWDQWQLVPHFVFCTCTPPPLFFRGSLCGRNAALCSVFSRCNGWIGSGVVASLITDWPSGIYIIMAGWPHSIHSFTPHTHSLLKINRLHCLLNGPVCSEKIPKVLWLNATVLLACCNTWDAAAAEENPKS